VRVSMLASYHPIDIKSLTASKWPTAQPPEQRLSDGPQQSSDCATHFLRKVRGNFPGNGNENSLTAAEITAMRVQNAGI
jgi:hypothetical protein